MVNVCVCLSGDELGMLEDMEVGVADLSEVSLTITEAKTEESEDLLPTLSGTWWETHTHAHIVYTQSLPSAQHGVRSSPFRGSFVVEVPVPPENFESLPQELKGCLIRVYPVLFNIGINQQQSLAERYAHRHTQGHTRTCFGFRDVTKEGVAKLNLSETS